MDMSDVDPDLGGWVLRWWHVLTALLGVALWAVRKTVAEPRTRLAAVEATAKATDAKLAVLATGIDEVRVAQTRMSDAHVQAIREVRAEQAAELGRMHGDLTSRMDQIVALMIGGTHTHRRRDDEEGL